MKTSTKLSTYSILIAIVALVFNINGVDKVFVAALMIMGALFGCASDIIRAINGKDE